MHAGGRLGVIVALDTAASGDGLDALAKDLAMHVAAHDPSPVAIDRDGVPKELLEKETEIFRRQAEQEGKPPHVTGAHRRGPPQEVLRRGVPARAGLREESRPEREAAARGGRQALGQPVRVTGFVRFKLGETATE